MPVDLLLRSKRVSLPPREGGTPGSAPGHYEVDHEAPKPVIEVMAWGPDEILETTVDDPAQLRPLLDDWPVTWVNVTGLGDGAVIDAIGRVFSIHPLALEDVVHVHQRAKVDNYGDHEFIVVRMASHLEGAGLDIEQVSIFLGRGFVLTFQERPGDCLDGLRARIRDGRSRARTHGADYLAYSVLDGVIDSYFPVLDRYSDRLDQLEDDVVQRPSNAIIAEVRDIRHDLVALRRAVGPLRDAMALLQREENALITQDTRLYLRDCHDHALQILDIVETYRDISSGLMDFYLSTASHRMNEVMQVLTVIGAIFIPLTFVTGLYGMNFDERSPYNMPELHWRYGYPAALGLMLLITLGLLFYFWRKGWLGSGRQRH